MRQTQYTNPAFPQSQPNANAGACAPLAIVSQAARNVETFEPTVRTQDLIDSSKRCLNSSLAAREIRNLASDFMK